MVEQASAMPALLVLTFRPEFAPPWAGTAHVLLLVLARLNREDSASMVTRVAGASGLPEEAIEQIVSRTDGVPLFVEELTQAVNESTREDAARLADRGATAAIPTTLQDSLTARLDRLGTEGKQVAQVGAVIGREFPYRLLAAAADLPERALGAALRDLERSGLMSRRGEPPHAEYLFKHALVQDTAYTSLLRNRRRALHARVVAALERLYPGRADAEPELLARHYAAAGDPEQSVRHWKRTLDRALARVASREAANNATEGLRQLEKLAAGEARDRLELEFQSALGAALMIIEGWSAPETGGAFEAARDLSFRLGDTGRLAESLLGISNFDYGRSRFRDALATCDQLVEIAASAADETYEMVGRYLRGDVRFRLGEFDAAREDLERAVALGEHVEMPDEPFWHLNDALAPSLGLLALVQWVIGYPEQARRTGDRALERARRLGRPYPLAMAVGIELSLARFVEPGVVYAELIDELDRLTSEYGFREWRIITDAAEHHRAVLERRSRAAAAAYRDFLVRHIANPFESELESAARAVPDEVDQALTVVDLLLDHVRKSEGRFYEAELHRQKGGMLLLQSSDHATAAEGEFECALDIAARQGARSWELRAALSLARLRHQQGKLDAARDMLFPIYSWFTESFETPDLKEARALLDALS